MLSDSEASEVGYCPGVTYQYPPSDSSPSAQNDKRGPAQDDNAVSVT